MKRAAKTASGRIPPVAAGSTLAVLLFLGAGCGRGPRPDGTPDETIDTADFVGAGWGSAPGYRLSWAVQAGGDYNGDVVGDSAWDVAFAPDGNLFFGGSLYCDDAFFGKGTASEVSFDTWDRGALYVARYSGDGAPLWVSSILPDMYEVMSVLALEDESVIVAGRVQSNESHPPVFGAGEPGEVVLDVTCDNCPFLAHYLPDGTFDWVAHGDGYRGGAHGLARAADGDLCVSGWFSRNIAFDDGTPQGILLADEDEYDGFDGFVARFDADGVALWARHLDTPPDVAVFTRAIALPDGSCAFFGSYERWARLETGGGKPLLVEAEGAWSCLVAKYDPAGNLEWAADLGIHSEPTDWLTLHQPNMGGLTAIDGDLIAAGQFNGVLRAGTEAAPEWVSAGPEVEDRGFYVAHLSGADGSRIWTSVALGTSHPTRPYDQVDAAAALPGGGVVIGGGFTGEKTFGAGELRETTLVSTGSNMDGFLAAYGDGGHLHWAVRVASSPDNDWQSLDYGEYVSGIGGNADGSILASGKFLKTCIFGTGPEDAVTFESYGGYDAFVLRLDPDETPPTQ